MPRIAQIGSTQPLGNILPVNVYSLLRVGVPYNIFRCDSKNKKF